MPTPDRDLDAEVAEKIFGLKPCKYTNTGTISGLMNFYKCEHDSAAGCYPEDRGECLAKYSTDIAAAWTVVEHLFAEGWALNISGERGPGKPWDVRYWKGRERGMAFAETAPCAICEAALAATRPAAEADA